VRRSENPDNETASQAGGCTANSTRRNSCVSAGRALSCPSRGYPEGLPMGKVALGRYPLLWLIINGPVSKLLGTDDTGLATTPPSKRHPRSRPPNTKVSDSAGGVCQGSSTRPHFAGRIGIRSACRWPQVARIRANRSKKIPRRRAQPCRDRLRGEQERDHFTTSQRSLREPRR
jgi:hypothetical protein